MRALMAIIFVLAVFMAVATSDAWERECVTQKDRIRAAILLAEERAEPVINVCDSAVDKKHRYCKSTICRGACWTTAKKRLYALCMGGQQ